MPENLPALINRARQRLADAQTSAEILEAKSVAEAALHYAKITRAANETHGDCLRIISMAETRMADEVDAGQANGEIASHGQHGNEVPPSLGDLGIDSRRLSDWRDVRDAGPDVVEGAIQTALDEGRAPTKADITRAVKPHVSNNSGNNEWYTPEHIISAARRAMGGIDLDPASSEVANNTVRAEIYFTSEDDGLAQSWSGRIWLNPPYAQPLVSQFADAVSEKFNAGEIEQACVLVNNATETSWFQCMLFTATAVCFLTRRVRFVDVEGNPSGAPLQGQAVLYFGENIGRFYDSFRELGVTLQHV